MDYIDRMTAHSLHDPSLRRVPFKTHRFFRLYPCACFVVAAGMLVVAEPAVAQGAPSLQQRYAQTQDALGRSPFGRPVQLESVESADGLRGDIYALVDQPFDSVSTALQPAANWCEVLMLHLNTKGCSVEGIGDNTALQVAVGRKSDQPLADAQRVAFQYRVATARPDLLDVRLQADKGPLSTRDYRIVLEAVPVSARQTFMHLRYSYGYGTAARLAMQGYLATIGRDKVGFTTEPRSGAADQQPVQGVRGVVERNTMRYYLAIDAFLNSLASGPVAEQRERRLTAWFDATERYPRQLREIGRENYLAMKRAELARSATLP